MNAAQTVAKIKETIASYTKTLGDREYLKVMDEIADHCSAHADAKREEVGDDDE